MVSKSRVTHILTTHMLVSHLTRGTIDAIVFASTQRSTHLSTIEVGQSMFSGSLTNSLMAPNAEYVFWVSHQLVNGTGRSNAKATSKCSSSFVSFCGACFRRHTCALVTTFVLRRHPTAILPSWTKALHPCQRSLESRLLARFQLSSFLK